MFRAFRPLFCLLLLVASSGVAIAGDRARGQQAPLPQQQQQDSQRDAQRDPQRDATALPDSVRRVERSTGGEVLRAEPMQRDGREVYRIKVLTADGRVRVVQDDPQDRAPEPHREPRREPRRSKDKDASSADGQDASQAPPQE